LKGMERQRKLDTRCETQPPESLKEKKIVKKRRRLYLLSLDKKEERTVDWRTKSLRC